MQPKAGVAATSGMNAKGGLSWPLFCLLLVSVWINYVDRGNLSVAAPLLAPELHLDNKQLGLLFSGFFWTYALVQVFSGWLVDRYPVSLVYAGGFFIWSIATWMTGYVSTFGTLFALRLILGIGESVSYPAYSKFIARGFTEERRGMANALVDACTKIGPAVGVTLGSWLMAEYGWRIFFIATGAASLFWLAPWLTFSPRKMTAQDTKDLLDAPPMRAILGLRAAWGSFGGLFFLNYCWYFLVTWIPSYLSQERHYTMEQMKLVGALPYWGIAFSALCSGALSDAWIRRGASVTKVRKTFVVSGLMFTTLLVPAALVPDPTLSMVLLVMGCLAFGLASGNHWAITQTLAGPRAAGKWTGVQNAIGNLGGVVSPYVTGQLVQRTGMFLPAFLAVAGGLVIGSCFYLFVIPRLVPVDWDEIARKRALETPGDSHRRQMGI